MQYFATQVVWVWRLNIPYVAQPGRHYSFEQLEAAYPQIQDFFAKKEVYDPLGLFDNLWFRHYGAKYLSEPYKIAPGIGDFIYSCFHLFPMF